MEEQQLLDALQKQTAALNAFAAAVMELAHTIADVVAVGVEGTDADPQTYLDGSEIEP